MLHTLEPKVFGVGVFGDFRPILATQETGLKKTEFSGVGPSVRRINMVVWLSDIR